MKHRRKLPHATIMLMLLLVLVLLLLVVVVLLLLLPHCLLQRSYA
jgi:hypothetical protein